MLAALAQEAWRRSSLNCCVLCLVSESAATSRKERENRAPGKWGIIRVEIRPMLVPNDAVIEAARQAAQPPSYDQVTVILTATAVILAALGVIFAIASVVLGAFAVFGYNDFKRMMKEQNEKLMQDFFAKFPTPQQLRDDLFNKVTGSAVAPKVEVQSQQGSGVAETATQSETVSESYPGEEVPNESGVHDAAVLDVPPDPRNGPNN
jgi:hypothetical protein